MTATPGWIEKELLETFYLIVEQYRSGAIDQEIFLEKIFTIADRYGRHAGKEDAGRNQMSLFTSSSSELK
jgi:hypothetical protein